LDDPRSSTAPLATHLGDWLDTAPCGFVSFDDDGTVVAVNATLSRRLGYTAEEVCGQKFEKILTVGSRLFYQTHLFPLVKLHGEANEIFLLVRAKDGETVGVLCNAVRRSRSGAPFATECILMEVRERRKYEDALLEAKRSADQLNQRLQAQAEEMEAQQEQLQQQATELEMQADSLQTLNNELHERTVELERERLVADDARRLADRANRAKSEFLAVMSHELRTPLNAIGGYAQLLEGEVYGPVSKPQQDALARIARSQRHLLGLINDVLNLARIETGRLEYSVEAIPVNDVMAELVPMIEPQLAAKKLEFNVDLPSTPVVVRADRDKMVQVLLNLLSNATKFTAVGGRITVRSAPDERSDRTVVVEVIDTGRGIPAEKLDAIFEPFVQVRGASTPATEGTGLGLAISRNLARGMGGELTVASEVGRGSTFFLRLPRA
jgi:PAS domain S-box-containing protein